MAQVCELPDDPLLLSNIVREKEHFHETSPTQSREETLRYLEHDQSKWQKDPTTGKYSLVEKGDTQLDTTVTENVRRKVSGIRKQRLAEINDTPDNDIYRDGGTHIHNIRDMVMRHLHDGVGELSTIRSEALNGPVSMSDASFQALVLSTKQLRQSILEQQKKIDPNGEVKILSEQIVIDPIRSIGGTVDVLAIFSDNTASLYDYKNKAGNRVTYTDRYGNTHIKGQLVGPYDLEEYELQIGDYKHILRTFYGIKEIRESRIIPTLVKYKQKSGTYEAGQMLLPEIELVKTTDTLSDFLSNEYLGVKPVAGELTGVKALDNLIDRLTAIHEATVSRVRSGKLPQKSYEALKSKANDLHKAITAIQVNHSVEETLLEIDSSLNHLLGSGETGGILYEPKIKTDKGKTAVNPNYLNNKDLVIWSNELAAYSGLIVEAVDYQLGQLKEESKKKQDPEKKLESDIKKLEELKSATLNRLSTAVTLVDNEILARRKELLEEEGIEDRQVAFGNSLENHVLLTSEIEHPAFQYLSEVSSRELTKAMMSEKQWVAKIMDKFHKLKKSVGGGLKMYDQIINPKTKELYDKYDKAFWKRRKEAFDEGDVEWIEKNHELRENARERYDEMLTAEKTRIAARVKAGEDFYMKQEAAKGNTDAEAKKRAKAKADADGRKMLQSWLNKYNVFDSKFRPNAYKSEGARFLKIKESTLNENLSEDYKRISQNEAVKEFYDMVVEFNSDMREVLNVSFRELPDRFTPNIRKGFMEKLVNSEGSFKGPGKAMRELYDDLSVREDDNTLYGARNLETGEIEPTIPMYFLNALKDKEEKSTDLAKSMIIFAKMAYKTQAMERIEGNVMAMKASLTLVPEIETDKGGNPKYDKGANLVKKKLALNSNTRELFDAHANYYLYGVRIRDKAKSFKLGNKNIDRNKFWLGLKDYYSKKLLGFAVIPGTASFVAAKVASVIESRKGIAFTSKQYANAHKLYATDREKYRAITSFFEAGQQDYNRLRANAASANFSTKHLTSETLFAPFRRGDQSVDDDVLISMTQNYGFDKDGNLKRMVNLKKTDPEAKSIFDSTTLNEKGELIIEGITTDGMNAFRRAVRSVTKNIKGSLTDDDIKAADTALLTNLMFQFKNWMPGFVQERTGKLKYDKDIDAAKFGRYRNFLSEYELKETEGWLNFLSLVGKNTSRLAFNISLGWLPGVSHLRNAKRAEAYYKKWARQNPEKAQDVTFELFEEIAKAQTVALANELRIVFSFIATIMMLGYKDDEDDEPLYQKNWLTRKLYQLFVKSENELTFLLSTSDFIRLAVTNPIPLSRVLQDLSKTIGNTVDESWSVLDYHLGSGEYTEKGLFGVTGKRDNTPPLYFTSQWFLGGIQLRRLLEVFDQDRENPYPD